MTNTMLISQAEENYLKAIFKISEQENKAVQTNAIAAMMNTAAASVTDMVKRLAEKQLISYEKYRGVQLTEHGNRLATALIRRHRLWETFLVEKLGFPWDQVHDLAEQLEHIQSETLTSRLDQFLGFPGFDPHGDPIPDAQGRWARRVQVPLSDMPVGQRGKLSAVADDAALFLQYLDQLGLALHSEITVLERFPFDNSVKVLIGERSAVLSEKVCQNLFCAL